MVCVDSSANQIDNIEQNHQFLIQPLIIQESVYHEFYNLYSNSTLWFLLHEMQSLWRNRLKKAGVYQLVNTLMAD